MLILFFDHPLCKYDFDGGGEMYVYFLPHSTKKCQCTDVMFQKDPEKNLPVGVM